MLALVVSAYQVAEGASDVTGADAWDRVEFTLAPVLAIATAGFVMTALPRTRVGRFLSVAASTYCLGLSLVTALGVVDPVSETGRFGSREYAMSFLVVLVPGLLVLSWRLVSEAVDRRGKERLEIILLIFACGIGVLGGVSDLLALAGVSVPRLSRPAFILAGAVFGFLALRGHMVSTGRLAFLTLLVAAMAGILGLSMLFVAVGAQLGPLLLGSSLIAVLLASGLRPLLIEYSEASARREYHTTLGRFTAQMAHDLQNPLASIRATAQFLLEERARGQSIDGRDDDLDFVVQQTRRIERIVVDYRRMGRLEVAPELHDLADVARRVSHVSSAWGLDQPVAIELDLPAEPLLARIDPSLLQSALENVVRNAWEASRSCGAGMVRLRASRVSESIVRLIVEDDGPGMTTEVRRVAADDFFTTKAEGSGLGLSLARRVLEVHGGQLVIDSESGVGTRVELRLPAAFR